MKLPSKQEEFEAYKKNAANRKATQTKKYLKPMPTDTPDEWLEQREEQLQRQGTGAEEQFKNS